MQQWSPVESGPVKIAHLNKPATGTLHYLLWCLIWQRNRERQLELYLPVVLICVSTITFRHPFGYYKHLKSTRRCMRNWFGKGLPDRELNCWWEGYSMSHKFDGMVWHFWKHANMLCFQGFDAKINTTLVCTLSIKLEPGDANHSLA